MHRFYVSPAEAEKRPLMLSEREAHHALNVLRLRTGEKVVVLDGEGSELSCEVHITPRQEIELAVIQSHKVAPLPFQITLLQAITKGKAMDIAVQKAAELGAYRIVPIIADRSVSQPGPDSVENKVEKWQATAIDAIKQCGSAWLPRIEGPLKPGQQLASGDKQELTLIATLQSGAKHPRTHLDNFLQEKGRLPKTIAVWVGPEGDFTPAEINAIRSSGALPITLGQLVLRSETASIYCLSVLNYEMQAPRP